MNTSVLRYVILVLVAWAVTACDAPARSEEPSTNREPSVNYAMLPQPVVPLQDIMTALVDPAADFLWESVSTEVSAAGTVEHLPRTDEEWRAVRRHAVMLTEGANLLALPGRMVVLPGHELEDAGTPGNLAAAEVQTAMQDYWPAFAGFAAALREVGNTMYQASLDRDPEVILETGERLDTVCESCHLQFWYPGQYIPPVDEQLSRLK